MPPTLVSPVMPSNPPHGAEPDGLNGTTLDFRRLRIPQDIPLIHGWFQHAHAAFWCLQGSTQGEVQALYQAKLDPPRLDVHLGLLHGRPVVLAESYDPRLDPLADHYDVQDGDIGMHIFVAPATRRIPGFTRCMFKAVMDLMFNGLGARRVVVEPDIHNDRIHVLNKAYGFVYQRQVVLRDKTAWLALCTRRDFHNALTTQEMP